MSVQASVTIPYSEFEEIQNLRRKAEERAALLEKQLTEGKIESSDQALLRIALSAIEVTRFAISMLPPESTRNWPAKHLREIAQLMPLLPTATDDHKELARTMETFALECERFEQRRRAMGPINPETLMPFDPTAR